VLTFDCGVCHPAELEPHGHEVPAPYDTLCLGCHPADNAADLHVDTASGCDACHGDGITPSLVCSDCHTVTDPPHADADHTVPAPFDVDCMGCHTADDGADLHAGTASGCSACHADGVTATLVCLECHTVVYPPPHSEVDHTADVGATADPSGKLCADCHAMDVTVEHEKTSSSTAGQSCGACHPTPRDTFDTWDQGCVQGGCHAAGSDAEQHADQTLAHTLPDDASACMGAGCHSGTDLADVHADAGTEPITACLVCHASGVPTTDSCADCHPDKLEPHGYDAEQHTADLVGVIGFVPVWDAYDGVDLQSGHGDSYFNLEPIYMPEYCLDCHSADLAVLHPDGCVTCHPTPRDTFHRLGRQLLPGWMPRDVSQRHRCAGGSYDGRAVLRPLPQRTG
jgi:hypothetical protein